MASLGILHSQSPYLYNTAGLMSLFPLGLGLYGVLNPANGFGLFGFPKPKDSKLAEGLFLFWISRDLYMAFTAMAAWYFEERKTLGAIYLLGCGVAICDGIMSQRIIGKDAWKHVIWVPVIGTIGGGLLGWFD